MASLLVELVVGGWLAVVVVVVSVTVVVGVVADRDVVGGGHWVRLWLWMLLFPGVVVGTVPQVVVVYLGEVHRLGSGP